MPPTGPQGASAFPASAAVRARRSSSPRRRPRRCRQGAAVPEQREADAAERGAEHGAVRLIERRERDAADRGAERGGRRSGPETGERADCHGDIVHERRGRRRERRRLPGKPTTADGGRMVTAPPPDPIGQPTPTRRPDPSAGSAQVGPSEPGSPRPAQVRSDASSQDGPPTRVGAPAQAGARLVEHLRRQLQLPTEHS